MSVKIMGQVWDLDLPPQEKLVLQAYADHADHNGRNIYPSINLIARKTGYSERHVQRMTRILEDKGLLLLEGNEKGGRSQTRIYYIPLDEKGDILSPFNLKRVTSETKRVTSTTLKGDSGVTRIINNHHINHQSEEIEKEEPMDDYQRKVAAYKERIIRAMQRGAERYQDIIGKIDVSQYPPDVQEITFTFAVLWNMRTPAMPRKRTEKSPASHWIVGARELQDSCGEFGLEALYDYRRYFEEYMQSHNGIAPHRVNSPASLVNVIRGHTATMRETKSHPHDKFGAAREVYTAGGRIK